MILDSPFSEGIVVVYAVLGETATLVDTGNPGEESFYQLKSLLKVHNLKFTDFDHMIVTHMHTDHCGGVSLIQQEAGLPVHVHELARPVVTGGEKEFNRINQFFNDFIRQCGADPSIHQHARIYKEEIWRDVHYLKEGDDVYIGGRPHSVLHVPVHSQTDILLVDEQQGITFVGDHIIPELAVNSFIEPPVQGKKHRPTPLIQYRESLIRSRGRELGTCYSGHGKPFTQHIELIDKRLVQQDARCQQIHQILKESDKNVYEICLEVYPHLKGGIVFLGLSQIQGHLDLMIDREEVKKELRESVLYYKLT
ncbi:MBL fold metallo-hydrolase [Mesobacillus subterraneus]|uniref:MBL fold metallo-hydrolase n=1 Tax=Mesobacillus subterraneus TaxID=285983 RepID=UPI00273FCF81|nr:MBL fold metallo-hydrolase [Mesobacillus subterraneus]WLR57139.1 MBL fold metallo-hydrolase [Mesobacillus subterraneus]